MQRVVSSLEGQTREAFGHTETTLGSMRKDLVSNIEKLTNLENALRDERRHHIVAEEKMR